MELIYYLIFLDRDKMNVYRDKTRVPEILKNISIFWGIFLGKIYHFPSKTKVLYEFVGILVSRELLVKYF